MAVIPDVVRCKELFFELVPLYIGKVRNTAELPLNPDKMLVVATPRISIFDFVLNALVPFKGQVLNAINVFWVTRVFKDMCQHDLVAYGEGVDEFLPQDLRRNTELQKVATVVRRLKPCPVEAVVRGYLTGSGLKDYRRDGGRVAGHHLPSGLVDGSKIPYPIFTPATKAQKGHDENITADSVAKEYGVGMERLALQLFGAASNYAETCGVIIADTKFEMALLPDGTWVLIDERLTPDSSRFWPADTWAKILATGGGQISFDKQSVRDEGKKVGIDQLKLPDDPHQIAQVHAWQVPEAVLAQTTRLYRYIFWRLTGEKLESFQADAMGIDVEMPHVRVDVVLGSRSDLPQAIAGIEVLEDNPFVTFRVHICSCHRNPDELRTYASELASRREADVVVAGAGMAAQLPAVLKAHLCDLGADDIPVIGVAFEDTNKDNTLAAQLSIKAVPGRPVEVDSNGKVYTGSSGMVTACKSAAFDEFLPKRISKKPAEWDINPWV